MLRCFLMLALALLIVPPPANAGALSAQTDTQDILPLTDFSPALLGMFRKVMEIEDDIRRFSDQYDVSFDLARAVCLHESGGNPNLRSGAGARGYFQVMPATFRSLRVETNIEAGIKYLSEMTEQFGREDYALAAYNAGPGRVRRGRPPLETLQYVLAVGQFRNVLKLYEPSIRHHAGQIDLESVREGDTWWAISQRVGIPVLQLRMHNPFLATRPLRAGQLMAYPRLPRTDLLAGSGDDLTYRSRHGDNYLHLAFILDIELDEFRAANELWRLQTLPAGQLLRVPLGWQGRHDEHRVEPGEDLAAVAAAYRSTPWRIIRDNGLFEDERLEPGTVLKVRAQRGGRQAAEAAPAPAPAPAAPTHVTHRVARGDTLGRLARRYGTTIRAIQAANDMGRRTVIRVGQRLRIPSS